MHNVELLFRWQWNTSTSNYQWNCDYQTQTCSQTKLVQSF